MPDDDAPLLPATADELHAALSHALRFDGRKAWPKAAELMSDITAERLVGHLERAGFVVLKKAATTNDGDAGGSEILRATRHRGSAPSVKVAVVKNAAMSDGACTPACTIRITGRPSRAARSISGSWSGSAPMQI